MSSVNGNVDVFSGEKQATSSAIAATSVPAPAAGTDGHQVTTPASSSRKGASRKPPTKRKPRGYKHDLPTNVRVAMEEAMKLLHGAEEHLRHMREWQKEDEQEIAALDKLISAQRDSDPYKAESVKRVTRLRLHLAHLSDLIADLALDLVGADRTLAQSMVNSRREPPGADNGGRAQ